MTKKPRDNRVPIMMSEEELAAIDDWRFQNRVATRSDAVRRLCQIALRYDSFAVDLDDTGSRLAPVLRRLTDSVGSLGDAEQLTAEDAASILKQARSFVSKSNDFLDILAARHLQHRDLSDTSKGIAEAIAAADEIIQNFEPKITEPDE